ncbi:hypothetical protein [Candidatus Viridilinea mediisalina]|uniref:hypothetical protein n=1 Tax=Candidatus Viridilinea mediisalina TaxID=2024553 RepID=UPI00157F89CD|nr:hypothetical protein [Candidatus Viridilinea mediisalina]
MNERYTFTIEVYTSAMVFTGSYDLPLYRRVSDALNSRLHRFIALRDASIAPLGRPQHAQRVPQILVDWSDALLVATMAEPTPPPDFQMPTPPRDTQPMMFFTSTFALRADFFKRTDRQLIEMLDELNDDFIALSNVLIFPHAGGNPLNRDFVCLNQHHIQALYVLGAAIANAPVPASAAPAVEAPPPEPEPAEPAEPTESAGEERDHS